MLVDFRHSTSQDRQLTRWRCEPSERNEGFQNHVEREEACTWESPKWTQRRGEHLGWLSVTVM